MRANFGWILAGNVLNAAAQWAVLSLLAKLGGSRMLGEYAYGLAVAMPIAMLAHLNLRAVLATDVGSARGRLGDYLSVRFAASFAGIVAITVAAAILASSRTQFAVMVVLGIAL